MLLRDGMFCGFKPLITDALLTTGPLLKRLLLLDAKRRETEE